MVDGLNPQAGNLLRELGTGSRQESPAQRQAQDAASNRGQQNGAARPVSEVSVEISAQGQQLSTGEQLTSEAVTATSATDTNVTSTFASADFEGGSREANREARVNADSLPDVQGTVTGSSSLSADQALGTNVDTRA
ncbi:MAG: hypothetical protein R3296_05740 [Oleiphilaceae bacterium]|nr:hypothetical protein [Oleiphilaceae bacterium]